MQTSQQIPESMKPQTPSATEASLPTSQVPTVETNAIQQPIQQTQGMVRKSTTPAHSLYLLHAVAKDIKEALTAIADLHHDLQDIADRMQEVEISTTQPETQIVQLHTDQNAHTLQLREMQRHLEALDNRGRRNNLRVRGIPEAIEYDQIQQTVTAIFNNLLDRPATSPIEMERIHRALSPKWRDTDPP